MRVFWVVFPRCAAVRSTTDQTKSGLGFAKATFNAPCVIVCGNMFRNLSSELNSIVAIIVT